jgi:phosphate transport system protein
MTTKAHASRDFDAELQSLAVRVRNMGERCVKGLDSALDAFFVGDTDAANAVRELDRAIDRDEKDIDALVLRMLALRQPVAEDLRMLAATLKLATDLERIGDEAENVADNVGDSANAAYEGARDELGDMAVIARTMLHDALDAFATRDVARAEGVLVRDDDVDRRYERILSDMAAHMRSQPEDADAALRIIRVAHCLERVADHATNIAEEAIFAVRGDDIRHPP